MNDLIVTMAKAIRENEHQMHHAVIIEKGGEIYAAFQCCRYSHTEGLKLANALDTALEPDAITLVCDAMTEMKRYASVEAMKARLAGKRIEDMLARGEMDPDDIMEVVTILRCTRDLDVDFLMVPYKDHGDGAPDWDGVALDEDFREAIAKGPEQAGGVFADGLREIMQRHEYFTSEKMAEAAKDMYKTAKDPLLMACALGLKQKRLANLIYPSEVE